MNVGPEVMPTMAMKTLRPTEFMNQSVGCGMLPICGFTVRNQPTKMPAISAPPDVLSVIGTPPMGRTAAPIRPPIMIAKPTSTMSVTVCGLSA